MSEKPIKAEPAILLENGIFHAMGLILVLFLKEHYSTASPEGLRWILSPVAGIVCFLTGTAFEWAPGSGYVSHFHGVVIAPACAGVNFLIICFGALFFSFVSRLRSQPEKCAWLFASAFVAFLVTLIANSLRIILSIRLYEAPIYTGWLTPGRVHQLAGMVIFITLLVLTWLIAERMVRPAFRCTEPTSGAGPKKIAGMPGSVPFLLFPFAWYGLITVIVPLLNGAAGKNGPRFAEHSIMVMLVCGCVFLITAHAKKKVDRPD